MTDTATVQDAGTAAEDVGFALSCLTGGLVPLQTFQDALVRIIERSDVDALPACVFDMLDLRDRHDLLREVDIPPHIRVPTFMTDRRIDALIGLRRELKPEDKNLSNVSDTAAAAALAACPEVRTRYEDLFGGSA